jgi:cytochrome oxidase assembly protein ShyY1
MEASHFALIEMVFSFGIVLALGLWELVRLRRDQRRTQEKAARKAAEG